MRNLRKRAFAYLVVLALLAGWLPACKGGNTMLVWAADNVTSANASADVYVTIVDKGEVAVGTDEDNTLMAQVPVHVTDVDEDGKLTFNDAMVLTHEQYASADAYASSYGDYGLSVTTLWGDTSGAFGYYINDEAAWSAADEVETGDFIVSYIYKDVQYWTDTYTCFDSKQLTIVKNEDLTLHLTEVGWSDSSDFSDARLTVVDNQGWSYLNANTASSDAVTTEVSADAVRTDASGNAKFSFDKIGTYVISVQSDNEIIVPATCVVTVLPPYDETFANAYQKSLEYVTKVASSDADAFATIGNEWNIQNLARANQLSKSIRAKYIANAKKYVAGKNGSVEAKYVLTLASLGVDVTKFNGYNLITPLTEVSTDTYPTTLAYVIMALNSDNYGLEQDASGNTIADTYALALNAKHLETGGWSWGDTFDADTTAMVIQALAPYYHKNVDITAQIDRGLELLKEAQAENGGIKGYGDKVNVCTTAETWLALTALELTPEESGFASQDADIIAFMQNCQLEDGSFQQDEDKNFATYESTAALIAYERLMTGKTAMYDYSDIKEKEVITADADDKTDVSDADQDKTPSNNDGSQGSTDTQTPAQTSEPVSITLYIEQKNAQSASTASDTTKVKTQKIKKITAGKNKFTVTWKQNKNAAGYEVQYSTSKKFTKKTTQTVVVKKNTKTTVTVKKLKSKKSYYVRVRSYKNSDDGKVYGSYSPVQTVTVK